MKTSYLAAMMLVVGFLLAACGGDTKPNRNTRTPASVNRGAAENKAADGAETPKETAAKAIVYHAGIEGMG